MKKGHPRQESRQTVLILSSWGPKNLKIKPFAILLDFPDPPPQTHAKKQTPDMNRGKRLLF